MKVTLTISVALSGISVLDLTSHNIVLSSCSEEPHLRCEPVSSFSLKKYQTLVQVTLYGNIRPIE